MTRLALLSLAVTVLGCSNVVGDESEVPNEDVVVAAEELRRTRNVLRNRQQAVQWTGVVGPEDAPTGGEPPECAEVPCDHYRLKIDLPRNTFANPNHPGGVQVAVRWFGNPGPHTLPPGVPGCCGEFDTLHLWVYKDGELRAASPGIIAVSQSALLQSPENGVYDVWIAYDPTYNVAPSVEYEALAEVEYAPPIRPLRRTLPDLTFRGTERITFATPSFPIFEPEPPAGASCFVSETEEDGAQNCLRFDQIIANEGEGPLELGFTVPAGDPQEEGTTYDVVQHVYSTDGSVAPQAGGEVEFHGVHGHYHYSSFASSELWASNARGRKLGAAPISEGRKVSFCIADIRIDTWAEKGDGPRTYYAPDCLFPAATDADGDHYVQGLTHGWADIYDWYVPDQYLEVTGVADGYYRLEFCADPDNSIEEEDESNNCLINHLRLTGMGTPAQSVQVLGVLRR